MTSSTGPLLRLPMAVLAAVGAGVLLWLAFPPVGFGPSAAGGVALLTAALWRARLRRGLGLGLLTGLVFFALLLEWMRVIGPDAWLLLTLLCASWIALLGMGTALVTRLPLAPVWVGSLWVLDEALRARIPFGGFPWGNLAFGQPDSTLGDWASAGGTPLVTFAVALVGASVVSAVLALRAGQWRVAAGWTATVIALGLLPVALPVPSGGDEIGGAASATVALVQGGTPQTGMGAMDVRRAVLDNHVRETLALAEAIDAGTAPAARLRPVAGELLRHRPLRGPVGGRGDHRSGAGRRCADPGRRRHGGAGQPDGRVERGHRLGPGGRSHPDVHQDASGAVRRVRPLPGAARRSSSAGSTGCPATSCRAPSRATSTSGESRSATSSASRSPTASVVDAVIDGGARLLTVQTNNATYGGTSQPAQQLGIERMRAGEFGRTVLVAATSGITAVIGTDRAIEQQLGEEETGWLVAEVPLHGSLTLAARVGHLVELLLCLIALAAVGVAATMMVRSRRRRADGIA